MTPEAARDIGCSVILNAIRKGTIREQLKAAKQLADIYGYEAPRRHELTGTDGAALQIEAAIPAMSTERLAEVVAMLEQAAQPEPKRTTIK